MKELPRRRFLRDTPAGLLYAASALQPAALRAAEEGGPPWAELSARVSELVRVRSPLEACLGGASPERCDAAFKSIANPWYLGDEVSLTQSLGWVVAAAYACAQTAPAPRLIARTGVAVQSAGTKVSCTTIPFIRRVHMSSESAAHDAP